MIVIGPFIAPLSLTLSISCAKSSCVLSHSRLH